MVDPPRLVCYNGKQWCGFIELPTLWRESNRCFVCRKSIFKIKVKSWIVILGSGLFHTPRVILKQMPPSSRGPELVTYY